MRRGKLRENANVRIAGIRTIRGKSHLAKMQTEKIMITFAKKKGTCHQPRKKKCRVKKQAEKDGPTVQRHTYRQGRNGQERK